MKEKAMDDIGIDPIRMFYGYGVVQNKKKAIEQLEEIVRSNPKDYPEYSEFLGMIYAKGECVKQDMLYAKELCKVDVNNDWGGLGIINRIDKLLKSEASDTSSINNEVVELFEKVKKQYDSKEIEATLNAARTCMECILRSFPCNKSKVAQGDNALLLLIDNAKEHGDISKSEAELYHRLRKIGNKGSHYDPLNRATSNDLDLAYEYIREIVENYCKIKTNSPMVQGDPLLAYETDYYDKGRRYFGKWSNCFTKQSLLLNAEYQQLYHKAEEGDIEAMLNIAIGFLSERSTVNSNGMWNMPTYNDNGTLYNDNKCYDTRYYYWIMKAASKAVDYYQNYQKWKIPMKYIPTVLLESIKFDYYCYLPHDFNHFINGDVKKTLYNGGTLLTPINQWDLVDAMYDGFWGDKLFDRFDFLRDLMQEYDGKNIIHPLHDENTVGKLMVLYNALALLVFGDPKKHTLEEGAEPINGTFALQERDIGEPRNLDFINKYADMLGMSEFREDLRACVGTGNTSSQLNTQTGCLTMVLSILAISLLLLQL